MARHNMERKRLMVYASIFNALFLSFFVFLLGADRNRGSIFCSTSYGDDKQAVDGSYVGGQ